MADKEDDFISINTGGVDLPNQNTGNAPQNSDASAQGGVDFNLLSPNGANLVGPSSGTASGDSDGIAANLGSSDDPMSQGTDVIGGSTSNMDVVAQGAGNRHGAKGGGASEEDGDVILDPSDGMS